MHTTTGSRLELRHEGSSGYRHYLRGRAVHAGSLLELLHNGDWLLGRYEWCFRPERAPHLVTNAETDEAVILRGDAQLRWPE